MQAVVASTCLCPTVLQQAAVCCAGLLKLRNVVSAISAGRLHNRFTSLRSMALMNSTGTGLPSGNAAVAQHVLPAALSHPAVAQHVLPAALSHPWGVRHRHTHTHTHSIVVMAATAVQTRESARMSRHKSRLSIIDNQRGFGSNSSSGSSSSFHGSSDSNGDHPSTSNGSTHFNNSVVSTHDGTSTHANSSNGMADARTSNDSSSLERSNPYTIRASTPPRRPRSRVPPQVSRGNMSRGDTTHMAWLRSPQSNAGITEGAWHMRGTAAAAAAAVAAPPLSQSVRSPVEALPEAGHLPLELPLGHWPHVAHTNTAQESAQGLQGQLEVNIAQDFVEGSQGHQEVNTVQEFVEGLQGHQEGKSYEPWQYATWQTQRGIHTGTIACDGGLAISQEVTPAAQLFELTSSSIDLQPELATTSNDLMSTTSDPQPELTNNSYQLAGTASDLQPEVAITTNDVTSTTLDLAATGYQLAGTSSHLQQELASITNDLTSTSLDLQPELAATSEKKKPGRRKTRAASEAATSEAGAAAVEKKVTKRRAKKSAVEEVVTEAASGEMATAAVVEPLTKGRRTTGRKPKSSLTPVAATAHPLVDQLMAASAEPSASDDRQYTTSVAASVPVSAAPSKAELELALKAEEAEREAEKLVRDVYMVTSHNAAAAEKLYTALRYLAMCPVPHDEDVYGPHNKDTTRYFACDTEVAYIDVSKESPVGHGVVTCISIYCGPDVDLRKLDDPDSYQRIKGIVEDAAQRGKQCGAADIMGPDGRHWLTPDKDVNPVLADSDPDAAQALHQDVPQSRIWIDVWDEIEKSERTDDEGRLQYDVEWKDGKIQWAPEQTILISMQNFLEDDEIPKVWHNYSFDRHVLANLGIECNGFKGDTMHMARLHDASRRGTKNYSLENLSRDSQIMTRYLMPRKGVKKSTLTDAKTSMKDIFGKPHIKKDGELGKLVTLPPIHELHTDPKTRNRWIHYSALDAKATWQLREALYLHLDDLNRGWKIDPYLKDKIFPPKPGQQPSSEPAQQQVAQPAAASSTRRRRQKKQLPPPGKTETPEYTMWDLYRELWIDFGRILTDMEKRGMCVDREHLKRAEVEATAAMTAAREKFRSWISKMGHMFEEKHAQETGQFTPLRWEAINPSSGPQIRQLLYPEHGGEIHKGPPKKAETATATPPRSRSPSPAPAPTPEPTAATPDDSLLPPPPVPDTTTKRKKKKSTASQPPPVETVPEPAILDVCPTGCRAFTVNKEDLSEANQQLIPQNKKWVQMYLHGIWGRGNPGRLVPEAHTPTGAAVVNMRVLRSLSGKVGKAKAALEKLRAEQAAQKLKDDEEAAKKLLSQAGSDVRSVLVDEEEEILQQMLAESAVTAGDDPEASVPDKPTAAEDEEAVLEESPRGKTIEELRMEQQARNEKLAELEQVAKENGWGKMYAAMAVDFGHEAGLEACEAIEALCEASAIEKLLTAFIIPLQSDRISTQDDFGNWRVHCSLNINTETGRLSARRPNLQNQPALEKDLYKVRKAFTAPKRRDKEGNEIKQTLVVADYGQLELRLLAHMADCKSMLEAFVLGGDFHSRTAAGMYDYIKADIAAGGCYMDNPAELPNGGKVAEGQAPPQAVKDKYASERRKAKILNFSIAYGKTAHGLAKDFGTTLEEAQNTVDRWYADRAEVRAWQDKVRSEARAMWDQQGYVPCVYTLLGRTRPLQDLVSDNWSKRGHAERAAINTPIQGAAADAASSAMIAISKCPELDALDYKLIMQVHDEVILEGPEEHADKARALVQKHMANPWRSILAHLRDKKGLPPWDEHDMPLRVELATDCDNAPSWYEAK